MGLSKVPQPEQKNKKQFSPVFMFDFTRAMLTYVRVTTDSRSRKTANPAPNAPADDRNKVQDECAAKTEPGDEKMKEGDED